MTIAHKQSMPSAYECLLENPVFLKALILKIKRKKEALATAQQVEKVPMIMRPYSPPSWKKWMTEGRSRAAKARLRRLEENEK